MSLGIQLGLVTSLVVGILLGLITANQQRQELERDRRTLERLLAQSLAPLTVQIEQASTQAQVTATMEAFHAAHVQKGMRQSFIALRDRTGKALASFGDAGADPEERLEATVRVSSAALGEGPALLTLAEPGRSLVADGERRWYHWRMMLLFTVVCVVGSIQVAIYLLLTRPLGRLVGQLRTLEAGYACDIEPDGGAWEIRWLGWQVHRLCTELSESARCLIRAERRAESPPAVPAAAAARGEDSSRSPRREELEVQRRMVRRYLQDRLRLLASQSADDPGTRSVAEEVWRKDVVEAERFGQLDLKAELENRALEVLDPEGYAAVSRELRALTAARETWPGVVAAALEQVLREDGVQFQRIQHRIKHAAGVWQKMQERGLPAADVQDVFAFRIIVGDEHTCYAALRAVHRRFEPEPFRFKDYIAEPKENGYRSIHTAVRAPDGLVFEVQIRSVDMHHAAERGASAHWRYVAGKAEPERAVAARTPGYRWAWLKGLPGRRPWKRSTPTDRP